MPELPLCIICDLDGTLALIDHRDPYDASECELDELNRAVSAVLHQFKGVAKIILVSGRQDLWRAQTQKWLENHAITYDALHMRQANDFRKDSIIKSEIYNRHIKPRYDVLFVLDDRNQVVDMWRQVGLTCFQVAPGNF